jgi:Na+-transporting methylmalonyl-CoA/oxaloacetate decarboxylase gamma subunit
LLNHSANLKGIPGEGGGGGSSAALRQAGKPFSPNRGKERSKEGKEDEDGMTGKVHPLPRLNPVVSVSVHHHHRRGRRREGGLLSKTNHLLHHISLLGKDGDQLKI